MISAVCHTHLPATEHDLCSSKKKKDYIIPKFSAVRKNRTVQVFAL